MTNAIETDRGRVEVTILESGQVQLTLGDPEAGDVSVPFYPHEIQDLAELLADTVERMPRWPRGAHVEI